MQILVETTRGLLDLGEQTIGDHNYFVITATRVGTQLTNATRSMITLGQTIALETRGEKFKLQ